MKKSLCLLLFNDNINILFKNKYFGTTYNSNVCQYYIFGVCVCMWGAKMLQGSFVIEDELNAWSPHSLSVIFPATPLLL